jgi:PhnB protein
MLVCHNKAEFLSKLNKLAGGGRMIHPGETFFAGTMGNIVDKFGIRWGVFTAEK